MNDEQVNAHCQNADALLCAGHFGEAQSEALCALKELDSRPEKTSGAYFLLFQVAGLLIDIGHLARNKQAALLGLQTLERDEASFIPLFGAEQYYYCLGNAKGNLAAVESPDYSTFASIHELVEVKNCFWRAVRAANGKAPPQYMVNLANSLKQQFRLAEALDWYDHVAELRIPQAQVNRSESLKILNNVSNSFSVKLLDEVANGYEAVLDSPELPPQFQQYYRECANDARKVIRQFCLENEIDPDFDHRLDDQEYAQQTAFRKFCIDQRLALSEHSLYCRCAASTRDNLTIPTESGVSGDFIVPMEAVLNRLKSEFSFCRRLYFEYLHQPADENLLHESCFSELLNHELLGLQVEKLRTSFKACFGILDKIAEAVCDLYGLHPVKGRTYFESFWQLDKPSRMQQFEDVKSPGMLALYSIATDLNGAGGGEWAFFKKWRNALEHGTLILQPAGATDVLGSFEGRPQVILVSESDFVYHLKHMLRLTRSAIFSFVFLVRDRGLRLKEQTGTGVSMSIHRQNYEFPEQLASSFAN